MQSELVTYAAENFSSPLRDIVWPHQLNPDVRLIQSPARSESRFPAAQLRERQCEPSVVQDTVGRVSLGQEFLVRFTAHLPMVDRSPLGPFLTGQDTLVP
ncbi:MULTISPECIES: hypothetical protein [unclassified Streptomyces]|uniref:hypothetical protein n=1 Tax=unclassified Streptomyces TaxID=2593676 RepID=UPI002E110E81|nr:MULTISPECIES: hypothetical protein [unclassified Streptomyces]WSJ38573.1 hypothetical protein OG772_22905 [Streptomyces sp. NBC_01321]WSP64862.1 hypothetical protein OG466_25520 [Streptomyces sp. NBC_01240]